MKTMMDTQSLHILVVEDAAGNSIVPSIQRYRSPYFVGPPPNASSVPFRLEPRFRRASVFLVDEYYQQAQSQPQIMVHVPMNLSGLDHDYYIHKYETSFYSGNAYNYDPPGSEYWPLQGTTADWKADAGICHDVVLRTGVIDPVGCGNGTLVNASTHKVQSKRGTYPLTYVVPGSLWKGCRNTTLSSGSGFAYPLLLSTDSEWTKAADWEDWCAGMDGFGGLVMLAAELVV
ncbi:MAG: hypothetical protein EOO38_23495 [Cytophagaceae bacterium]|nr:MAG: hypothetical protein EOO38_23495 [Cytophagaceae bacterium]